MATNDPIFDLNNILGRIEKAVGVKVASRKFLTELGVFAVKRIRQRTRLGYGVEEEGKPRKRLRDMRPHSDRYTQWRVRNADKLSGLTRPKKVNLTLSGKMLGQLRVDRVKLGSKSVVLGFSEQESRDKAKANIGRGWKFLTLSDVEQKAIQNQYQRILNAVARGLR